MDTATIDLDDGSEIIVAEGYPRRTTTVEIRPNAGRDYARLNEVELNLLINTLHNRKKNL